MTTEIIGAAALGAAVGSVLTWSFSSETDEQARLREERIKRNEEYHRHLADEYEREQREIDKYGSWDEYNNAKANELLMAINPPMLNTLRYECTTHPKDLPIAPLDRIFKFSNEHMVNYNGFSTSLSDDATAFFNRISECQSEYEARMCIKRFKEQLEFKINNSDLPDEYKQKFYRVLNPMDCKEYFSWTLLGIGFILSAFNASPVGLIATTAACAGVQLFAPEARLLPLSWGPIADPNAFRHLIADLNKLVSDAENDTQTKMRP